MSRNRLGWAVISVMVVAAVLFGAGVGVTAARGMTGGSANNAALSLFGASAQSQAGQSAAELRTISASAAQASANAAPAAMASPAALTITIQPGADTESQILEAVYQKVNPSVVQVINLSSTGSSGALGGSSGGQVLPQGEGSGFVWDTQGNIVTNQHVVDGSQKLQVIFSDGTQLDATLVGADANGDVAVIKVDPSLVTLVPVEQGNLADVKVGQMAIAIGNPFGLQGTMTKGIVSAIGRSIPAVTGFSIPESIQTDAAINPGNSGGPLLNQNGQVIGINDQIQSSSGSNSGVGFAIPISLVQRIVPSLIQTGTYNHSYMGISGSTFSKAWATALGLPSDAKGAYVSSVEAGSPADKAGLKAGNTDTSVAMGSSNSGATVYLQKGGDLITGVDGQPITKMDDLLIYLEEHTSPGQVIKLSVIRSDGQKATLSLTLGQRPTQAPSLQQQSPRQQTPRQRSTPTPTP